MADFTVNKIFTDHAVFQARQPVRVFGKTDMTGKISVSMADFSVETEAVGEDWLAELPPLSYGGPYLLSVTAPDGSRFEFSDIYVGEVLLLAGQSNIQWPLGEVSPPPEDYISNPKLRCYMADNPIEDRHFTSKDGWVPCRWDTVGYWSALGFYAGDRIQKITGAAVGLIGCYQGSSPIQSWLPKEVAGKAAYQTADQNRDREENPAFRAFSQDGFLYEYTFRPILPYAIGSVVWYQGESNNSWGEAANYDAMLQDLIAVWRSDLGEAALPFYVIQIADLEWQDNESWKEVQKAQARVCETVPDTFLIISADVSTPTTAHPPQKKEVANRLSDCFLAHKKSGY